MSKLIAALALAAALAGCARQQPYRSPDNYAQCDITQPGWQQCMDRVQAQEQATASGLSVAQGMGKALGVLGVLAGGAASGAQNIGPMAPANRPPVTTTSCQWVGSILICNQ